MYQHWEVSKEYGKMQSKAMKVLTEFIVGRAPGGESSAVQGEKAHAHTLPHACTDKYVYVVASAPDAYAD